MFRHIIGAATFGIWVLAFLTSPEFSENSAQQIQTVFDRSKRAVVKVIVEGTGPNDRSKHE